jgi:TRAP-type C4-dicarboxylate transport system permease small subunit
MKKWFNTIELLVQKLLMAVAAFFLLAMMLMTCADIVCRRVWKPLPGVFELMGLFGSLVVACALGYTQKRKDHLAVDIVTNLYPGIIQKILETVNRLACMLFAALACWQVAKVAENLMRTGEVTETLRMIYYPFTYGVAIGFGLLAAVFFVEMLKVFDSDKEAER